MWRGIQAEQEARETAKDGDVIKLDDVKNAEDLQRVLNARRAAAAA